MPQASDEQRAEFGIDDGPVIKELSKAGWILTPDWTWLPPPGHDPTEREIRAIQFLIDEWDFGPLATDTPSWERGESLVAAFRRPL